MIAGLDELDAVILDIELLPQSVVQLLGTGVTGLDEARKKDYAFAKSLLKLPTFSAPDIGNAFFGKVSLERFQQALYWAELARHYMPPGLLPRDWRRTNDPPRYHPRRGTARNDRGPWTVVHAPRASERSGGRAVNALTCINRSHYDSVLVFLRE